MAAKATATPRRLIAVLVPVLGALVLAGCARVPAPTPIAYVRIPTVQINEAENATTVRTPVGHRIEVTLAGAGWSFVTPSTGVLVVERPEAVAPGAGCGSAACEVTTITYATTSIGTASITAHFDCPVPGQQCDAHLARYDVTVVTGHR